MLCTLNIAVIRSEESSGSDLLFINSCDMKQAGPATLLMTPHSMRSGTPPVGQYAALSTILSSPRMRGYSSPSVGTFNPFHAPVHWRQYAIR